MKHLFKGQISCKGVFSKQARDSYYHGILAATDSAYIPKQLSIVIADICSEALKNFRNVMTKCVL